MGFVAGFLCLGRKKTDLLSWNRLKTHYTREEENTGGGDNDGDDDGEDRFQGGADHFKEMIGFTTTPDEEERIEFKGWNTGDGDSDSDGSSEDRFQGGQIVLIQD
ncbi:hypothetical protein L6452_17202 [Arctium lappa]|uniref:Uncharacterized protein n=1 Tax=Arctium lappa TaxID=4217 RepID=A0ACB9C2Q0_ARCLA|nr:hypothetical protein L6452_17202 [Arctium lappa]